MARRRVPLAHSVMACLVALMLVPAVLLVGCAGPVSGTAERAAGPPNLTSGGAGATQPGTGSPDPGAMSPDPGAGTAHPSAVSPPPVEATTPVRRSVTINGIEYSGTKLTVTLVQIVDPVTSDSPSPEAGSHYVGLEFAIKNVGTTMYQDAPGLELSVTDDAHHQHQLAWVSQIDAGQLMPAGLTVAPGDSVTGYLAVELPDGTRVATVAYSSGAGGEVASWTLGR